MQKLFLKINNYIWTYLQLSICRGENHFEVGFFNTRFNRKSLLNFSPELTCEIDSRAKLLVNHVRLVSFSLSIQITKIVFFSIILRIFPGDLGGKSRSSKRQSTKSLTAMCWARSRCFSSVLAPSTKTQVRSFRFNSKSTTDFWEKEKRAFCLLFSVAWIFPLLSPRVNLFPSFSPRFIQLSATGVKKSRPSPTHSLTRAFIEVIQERDTSHASVQSP